MTETYFNNRIPAISRINIENRINAHGIDINNVVYNSKKLLVIPCPTTIVNEKGREFLPFVKVFHYKEFDSLYPLPKSLIDSFEYIINRLKNNKVKQNKMYGNYYIFLGTPFYDNFNKMYFSDINSAVIMAILFNINTIYSWFPKKNIKINKKLLPLMYMYNINIQDSDDNLLFNSEYIDLNKSGKNLEFIKNYHTNFLADKNFLYKSKLDNDISLYKFKRMTEYLNKKIQLVYSEKINKQQVYFRGADSKDLIYPDTHSVTNYIQRAMVFGETIFIIVEDPGHYCFDINFKRVKGIEYFSEINWDSIDHEFEYIMPPTIYHEIEKVNDNIFIISSNKDIEITEKNREIINNSIKTYNEIMKPYDLKDKRFILLRNNGGFYFPFVKDIIDGIVETDVYYKIFGPFYIVEEQLEPIDNKIFVDGFSYCNEKKCVNTFDYNILVEFDGHVDLSVYFRKDSNKQRKIPVYYTYNNDKHVEYLFKVTKVKSKEITITISQKNV